MIKSHLSLVNSEDSERRLDEVLLKEFVPIKDVTMGEGIDDK